MRQLTRKTCDELVHIPMKGAVDSLNVSVASGVCLYEAVRRFLKVDKVSTALGTEDKTPRAYRYGYGVLDENLNMQVDPGEKKVYFEVSDYSNTVFFENPH